MKILSRKSTIIIIALIACALGAYSALNLNNTPKNPVLQQAFASNIEQTKLADFKQDYIILDFWASWCQPCVKSLPYYETLFADLPPHKFAYVAVNLDTDPADAKQFLADLNLNHTGVFFDAEGLLQRSFSIAGLPTLIVLDKQRQEINRLMGFNPKQQQNLENLLVNLNTN
ncbi:TlpA family protein disulfide reductase [Catenovulum sp. 2E275]|uniref:TlpA family protein disulfide reductase n=1 Tax=Catenovulum sp. 2E275 TaxID=2980497 RepID=UPI0021D3D22D|nr:TlpA disulfide reductase family protein [Catenovulum sp. 2E275]MCU4676043.1 TlpA family protein disulfide reductase [Catenovulum sp. 2E275]